MPHITCKRCSVTRVNLLCALHERAFEEREKVALDHLKTLVALADRRGYAEGRALLGNSLGSRKVRALCWNVSSLLTDEDVEALGYKI